MPAVARASETILSCVPQTKPSGCEVKPKPKKTSQIVQNIAGMAFDATVKGAFGFAKNIAQLSQKKFSGGATVIAAGAPSNPAKQPAERGSTKTNIQDAKSGSVGTPNEIKQKSRKLEETVVLPQRPAIPQSRPEPGVLPFFATKSSSASQVQVGLVDTT